MQEQDIETKFEEIYEKKIQPKCQDIEDYRQKKLKIYNIFFTILFIGILTLIITIFSVNHIYKHTGEIDKIYLHIIGAIIFIITICALITKTINKNYIKKIKDIFLNILLAEFGRFEQEKTEFISLKKIKEFGLLKESEYKKDDDNILGIYKNTPLSLTETELYHLRVRNKSTKKVTDFKGLIIKTKMQDHINGIVICKPKFCITLKYCILGGQDDNTGNLEKIKKERYEEELFPKELFGQEIENNNKDLSINKDKEKIKRVHALNQEIENSYSIYTNNETEALKFVNKEILDKIEKIQNAFCAGTIDFVAENEYLYLFIDNKHTYNAKNYFEIGDIRTPLNDKKIFLRIFKELSSIFEIIDII